jgi:hypothetical protein
MTSVISKYIDILYMYPFPVTIISSCFFFLIMDNVNIYESQCQYVNNNRKYSNQDNWPAFSFPRTFTIL